MCGLAGIVWRDPREHEAGPAALQRMIARLHHRGPDGNGAVASADGSMLIGNARLAIRDLSHAGALPFQADDRLAIAYNGEVYNARELRAELEAAGHRFRSDNDAEVVVRGYAQWGSELPARLRGMFAFLILDQRGAEPELFCARDPLGIKPLYYTQTPRAIVFASELKALRASGLVSADIDPLSLQGYLRFGSVPTPRTIYQNVHALEPAHALRVSRAGVAEPTCYWQFPQPGTSSAVQAAAGTAQQLQDAIAAQLISDVPLGAFLSGGLDSSTVVALMARAAGTPVRTCSLAFEEKAFDESAYARVVAREFGTDHYERVISAAEVVNTLDRAFEAIDQPSIDGLNTFLVSQVAREAGLKVVLSGLGGDELFGGYDNTFRGVPRLLRIQRISAALPGARGMAERAMSTLPQMRWRKVAEALQRGPGAAHAYLAFRGLFTAAETQALLPEQAAAFDAAGYVGERAGEPDSLTGASLKSWVSRAELRTYTLNQLLRDTDVMSMAHSLEVRVPLLDLRLVEQVGALPAQMRFQGRGNKPLLRQIAATLLPAAVLNRTDKQGFTLPLERWLRERVMSDLLDWRGGVFDAFDPRALEQLRQQFRAGHAHWSRIWALSALQGWQANT